MGIAVRDLDEAIKFFEKIYDASLVWRRKFVDQKIESAFMSVGEARFELTVGLESQDVISKFIEVKGEGIHHISLEVDEFDVIIQDLKAKGLRVIAEADTEDFKAAFIHPKDNYGILLEIIKPKRSGRLWKG